MTDHLDPNASEHEPTYNSAAAYADLANMRPEPGDERAEDPTHLESTPETGETQQQRAAQEGWLQRRNLLEDTPRLTLKKAEFEVLRGIGLGDNSEATSLLINKAKQKYDLPPDAQYASVDITPEDIDQPHITKLVAVQEEDFGSVIDDGRLESAGVNLADIPRVAMSGREFELFKNAGVDSDATSLAQQAREFYGVKQFDQYAPQYALVDIESDYPNQPSQPLLVVINEANFGTVIDRAAIDKDDRYLIPDPDSPLKPDTDAYRTVDINETIADAWHDLKAFATELMKDKTENPLSGGNFWLRAGDLMEDQEDAYVWDNDNALAGAVELTINTPRQYQSICAVVGDRQDPRNEKPGMAQVMNPKVIFKIEGEHLKQLQDIYQQLYHEPDFALTPEQKAHRDEIFNSHLVQLTSEEASKNKSREDDERRRAYEAQQLQTRARPLPGSSNPYR